MRGFVTTAVLALMAMTASAAPGSVSPYHQRLSEPVGWELGPRAPADHVRTFTVALKHNEERMRTFRALVKRIVDPNDEMHRRFLTKDQVRDMTKSDDKTVATTRAWLERNGAEIVEVRGDAIVAKAKVGSLETMLGSRFHAFRHQETGRLAIRPHGDSFIPQEVAQEVKFFTGLFEMPFVAPGVKVENVASGVSDQQLSTYTIPKTIATRYQTPQDGSDNVQGNSVAVVEYGTGSGFIKEDWSNFLTEVAGLKDSPPYPTIVGPFAPGGRGDPNLDGECTLDIEVVSGLTTAPTYFVTIGDGWIYDFASSTASSDSPAAIYSISYGMVESQTCEIVQCTPNPNDPSEYISRSEDELQKLASMGITVLAASGDTGANGRRSPSDQTCQDTQHPLGASYPATSAWITAVGATMQIGDDPAPAGTSNYCDDGQFTPCSAGTGGQEVVGSFPACRITTGGGFSTVVAQPDWQKDAVARYVATPGVLPPAWTYPNTTLRGFPDVAALGARYLITDTNMGNQPGIPKTLPVAGTSASCPAFAAVVAYLNGHAIKNLGGPLGFLNPMLYAAAASSNAAFTDITVGSNNATEQATCPWGYAATENWDATTGLGSPLFQGIKAYLDSQLGRR